MGSIKVSAQDAKKIADWLSSVGFTILSPSSSYEEWRMKGAAGSAIYYKSGKLLLQGSDISSLEREISQILGNTLADIPGKNLDVAHVGADEVGKGDYFGPLVVSAFHFEPEMGEKLLAIGIGDSKKFADTRIVDMVGELLELEPLYSTVVLTPEGYNSRIEKYKNVGVVLGRLHAENISSLISKVNQKGRKCAHIVVDQFSPVPGRVSSHLEGAARKIVYKQFPKAEADVAVAAASLIARAQFLAYMEQMNSSYLMEFPKGATNVIPTAKKFVEKFGQQELKKVAKISFKTTLQVVGQEKML